jgi:N-acyl-D-aspartate/D-glutamate deacylase
MERHMRTLFGAVDVEWHDLAGFSDAVRAAGIFSNLAPLIGHGSLRVGVLGFEDRPPRDDELKTMKRLVEEAIRIGREAGGPTHISHHKTAGKANWGAHAGDAGADRVRARPQGRRHRRRLSLHRRQHAPLRDAAEVGAGRRCSENARNG